MLKFSFVPTNQYSKITETVVTVTFIKGHVAPAFLSAISKLN
jgi:hypothetical protein